MLPQHDRLDMCCSFCGARDHSYEFCTKLALSLERYRVEEYRSLVPTGRSWELNALNAAQAAGNATGRRVETGVKQGELAFKVILMGSDSSQIVDWFRLSE